ncbi:uncharacterized protein LOC134247133 [Saccostrea cucullata]|uniref:uncharacterized protein LOC134247133 n=1 Tax=Saccostrea cuccullata TaxID=36930 RepID=UPI002ED4D10E
MKKKNCNDSKVVIDARKNRKGLQKDNLRSHNFKKSHVETPQCSSSIESVKVKRKTSVILDLWIKYIKEMKNRNSRLLKLQKYFSDMDLMYEHLNQRMQALEKAMNFTEEEPQ